MHAHALAGCLHAFLNRLITTLLILLVIFYLINAYILCYIAIFLVMFPISFYIIELRMYLKHESIRYKDYGLIPASLYEWIRFRNYISKGKYEEKIRYKLLERKRNGEFGSLSDDFFPKVSDIYK